MNASSLPHRPISTTPPSPKRSRSSGAPFASWKKAAHENRSALRPCSPRRLHEHWLYQYRRKQFLAAHPYCQVWLAEHGIAEIDMLAQHGRVLLDGVLVSVPLATEIHHRHKRRGADMLDSKEWMAVSHEAHRRLEEDKTWARARGYLREF